MNEPIGKRVLIVDDLQEIRELISKAFAFKGYQVETLEHGESVIEQLSLSSFDLLVTDIEMPPHIDGISLLKAIKGNSAVADIPVVMLTNYDDGETVDECLGAGAFGFILKSDLSLQKLMATIDAITKSLDAHDERLPLLPYQER